MLTNIGLGVVVAAWIYQMTRVLRGGTALYALFLLGYSIGIALIVLDGFLSGLSLTSWLHLIAAVAALITLVSLQRHP